MKNKPLHAVPVAVLVAALATAAHATPVTIADGFVEAGISDYGTLGSNDNNPPGILYDKTGTGSYGINDFLTPGTPFEGFYITGTNAAGGMYEQHSNNTGDTTFNAVSPTLSTATSGSWTGTSFDGSLTVKNEYNLTTIAGRSVIAITTTLTNNTNDPFANLAFLRTLDPDPDVNAFGSYFTNNSLISMDEACGTGPDTGQTICIATEGSPYTHKAGISADWTTSPAAYLAGLNDGDGDYAIGLAFQLGDLAAGGSLTLEYFYALGADKGTASGGGVPEPASLALLGGGIAGLTALRRRRRKA